MLKLNSNNRGETIIEVLIALSILGLVLGLGYASASRSLRGSQDSQERSEASRYAQSIVEVIQAYAVLDNAAIDSQLFPSSGQQVCISTAYADIASSQPPVAYNPMSPSPFCQKGDYTAHVRVVPGAIDNNIQPFEYVVTVEWSGILSGARGEGITNQAVVRYKWVRAL